jgi:hypothetical protein
MSEQYHHPRRHVVRVRNDAKALMDRVADRDRLRVTPRTSDQRSSSSQVTVAFPEPFLVPAVGSSEPSNITAELRSPCPEGSR